MMFGIKNIGSAKTRPSEGVLRTYAPEIISEISAISVNQRFRNLLIPNP